MNIIKKIECKLCKTLTNLYLIEHPAKWTYFLCEGCVSKDLKEEKVKDKKD